MTTTTTQHTNAKAIIYALNTFIETCTDGEKGYGVAAADVREPWLKTLFERKSMERADFVVDLQFAIQKLGASPENEGTAKGAAHRAWIDARVVLEGRTDRAIVEECSRGEQAAVKAYEKAFLRAPLETMPSDVRNMIQLQYEAIQASFEEIRRQLVLVH